MTLAISERLSVWHPEEVETSSSLEGLKKVGVAVIIVDEITKKIWVIREKKVNIDTGKHGGEVSFPLETRKVGESIPDNVLGALREFRPLQPGEELVWVQGISLHQQQFLKPQVAGETVLLVLRHAVPQNQELQIFDDDQEVTPEGWWSPIELLAHPKLRPGVENFLVPILRDKRIEHVLDAVADGTYPVSMLRHDSPEMKYPLKREETPDWTGTVR